MPRKNTDTQKEEEKRQEEEMEGGMPKRGIQKKKGQKSSERLSRRIPEEEDILNALTNRFNTIRLVPKTKAPRKTEIQQLGPLPEEGMGRGQRARDAAQAEQQQMVVEAPKPSREEIQMQKQLIQKQLLLNDKDLLNKSTERNYVINPKTENKFIENLETDVRKIIYATDISPQGSVEIQKLYGAIDSEYNKCIAYLNYYRDLLRTVREASLGGASSTQINAIIEGASKLKPEKPEIFYKARKHDPFKNLYYATLHGRNYITPDERGEAATVIFEYIDAVIKVIETQKDSLLRLFADTNILYNKKIQKQAVVDNLTGMFAVLLNSGPVVEDDGAGPSGMGGGSKKKRAPAKKKETTEKKPKAKAPAKEKKESTASKKKPSKK